MRDDFDADDLRIISYIASGLNMSETAKQLDIDASRVSQRVKEIERILGATIFFRYGRGKFQLTKEGELLFEFAKEVDAASKKFNRGLALLKSDHGQLRIMAPYVALEDASSVLESVVKKFQHVRITLRNSGDDKVLRMVDYGHCDVGLVIDAPEYYAGVAFDCYRSERICIFSGGRQAFAGINVYEPIKIEQVAKYPFISLDEAQSITSSIKSRVPNSNKLIRASCMESGALLAANNLGSLLTIESLAQRYEREYGGQIIYLDEPWATVNFYICTREVSTRSPAQTLFIALLKSAFKNGAPRKNLLYIS